MFQFQIYVLIWKKKKPELYDVILHVWRHIKGEMVGVK